MQQNNSLARRLGPYPGIWLDNAMWKLGNQSALFFPAFKAAGGQLDEIVLGNRRHRWENHHT